MNTLLTKQSVVGTGQVSPLTADERLLRKAVARCLKAQLAEVHGRLVEDGVVEKGGPGSGNFGHEGRPGEVGGSGPGGETGASLNQDSFKTKDETTTELVREGAAVRLASSWQVQRSDLDVLVKEEKFTFETNTTTDDMKRAVVERYLRTWAGSSGGPVPAYMASVVASDLGLQNASDWNKDSQQYIKDRPELDRAISSLGRAMYANTQVWLSERGVTSVALLRSGSGDKNRLFTSWSTSWSGVRHESGRPVVRETVPAKYILSVPSTGFGTLAESEVVVLTRIQKQTKSLKSRSPTSAVPSNLSKWDKAVVQEIRPIWFGLFKKGGDRALKEIRRFPKHARKMAVLSWAEMQASVRVEVVCKGDVEGHPFRGNQWTGGSLFHGIPSDERLKSIVKEGIKISHAKETNPDFSQGGRIYMATTRAEAEYWAKFGSNGKHDYAVVEVRIPSDQSHLVQPDPNYTFGQFKNEDKKVFPKDIPPEWIVNVWKGEDKKGILAPGETRLFAAIMLDSSKETKSLKATPSIVIPDWIEDPDVLDALEKEMFKFAHGIDQTTADILRQELIDGMENGETISQLANRISDISDEWVEGWRSEMIARTETARAFSTGHIEAWRSTGVVSRKVWVAAGDACPFCQAMDGTVVELGENFFDQGDEQTADWRGQEIAIGHDYSDVNGPPLHPNCRCVLIAELSESVELSMKGGPGSGNFGHEGRPGEVGGSGEGIGKTEVEELSGADYDRVKQIVSHMSPDQAKDSLSTHADNDKVLFALGLYGPPEVRLQAGEAMKDKFPKDYKEWQDDSPDHWATLGEEQFLNHFYGFHASGVGYIGSANMQAAMAKVGPNASKGDVPHFFSEGVKVPEPSTAVVGYLQKEYDRTQSILKDGPESFHLFRGTNKQAGLPMESWTPDKKVATRFATQVGGTRRSGSVMEADVPRELVFATSKTIRGWDESSVKGKNEFVVLGSALKSRQEKQD
jgi:hypothetical protein